MKTLNIATVETYRKLVQTYIDLHVYNAALFWADKVVALTGNPKDIYWLGHCMYLLKQYHRAAHLLQSRNLDKSYILCNYLTVKCLFDANELKEALKVINYIDFDNFPQRNNVSSTPCTSDNVELHLFDDSPKNQTFASILLLKGKVLEAMDNRGLAAECYRQALRYDVFCFEAFDSIIKYHMLSAVEEHELINSLPIQDQCSTDEGDILRLLYESKLKKYHTPTVPKQNESKILHKGLDIMQIPSPQLNSPIPIIITTPTSMCTPNVARNNDRNLIKTNKQMQMDADIESALLMRLKYSLDLHVAQAERFYYNCDYQQCITLTESILKKDPYHNDCLPIHISCQVELNYSNKLFTLAHNLVDLYPNLAISWYAVGCYYYITGKNDNARRYLSKATCLDRLFGPAWLAFGHSFAIENEHDQAMAAYFKASQLMKGCHLPLLYIGLECGLTNNVRLAEKFFQQAHNVAPDDPFIMHEKGVIAFQNLDYESAEMHFRTALDRLTTIKRGILPQCWEPLLNNLGHTCRKLKKLDEALEFHNQALLLSPQSARTYSAIGFVHVLKGHTDEAVDWFHRALGLKRDDTFSTTMLNYVIEQLAEEKPPYPGAPDGIPSYEFNTSQSIVKETSTASLNEPSGMSMSIEVDMSESRD